MINRIRDSYNKAFSEETYENFVADTQSQWPNLLDFRVAETPLFVPLEFKNKLIEACEDIIDTLVFPTFSEKMNGAIPANQRVPNENAHSSFLAIDFAVCKNQQNELVPQLIELQGFPSVFGFQYFISEQYRKHFPIPENLENIFCEGNYWQELRSLIVGNEAPENVILLEIYPEKQKTRIDFAITEKYLGVRAVCYSKILKIGSKLFYEHEGQQIHIKRIYNRLIFDDLQNFPDLQASWNLTDAVDVTWVGHPNWFFKISKFTMPLLKNKYVPDTRYVSDYGGDFPEDLQNYVLKPLFSFAGSGVNLHVSKQDLQGISDPENYILQRKVQYEPVVQAPDGLVKAEIRMLYVWHEHEPRPTLLTNLARLSRGEMIGVRFNKDFTWVGGSTCFFLPNITLRAIKQLKL